MSRYSKVARVLGVDPCKTRADPCTPVAKGRPLADGFARVHGSRAKARDPYPEIRATRAAPARVRLAEPGRPVQAGRPEAVLVCS